MMVRTPVHPASRHFTGWLALLAATTFLAGPTGCGDDGTNNGSFNNFDRDASNNSNNRTNNQTNNLDAGTDTDAEEAAPLCDVIDDGFTLPNGEPKKLVLEQAVEPNIVSCGDFYEDSDLSGAYVLEFDVENPVRLAWTIDPVAPPGNQFELPPKPLVELRRGDACGRPERLTYCGEERTNSFDLVADTRYFMVINGKRGSTFELTLDRQELACVQGPDTCADGAITRCISELAIETYGCVGECLDESACQADSCQTALRVDPAGGMTLAGHRSAYTNEFDADGLTGCSPSVPGEDGNATPGVDVFVELTNLMAGQEVTIDASAASGNYAFFVLDACDASACLHAGALDDAFENRTTWTVPSGISDAILVVEAQGTTARDFNIGLSAQ